MFSLVKMVENARKIHQNRKSIEEMNKKWANNDYPNTSAIKFKYPQQYGHIYTKFTHVHLVKL